MHQDVEFMGIPYDKVIKAGGTPFPAPSKVILSGAPTTLWANYPPVFIPWSYFALDTKRILVAPDDGVMDLCFEEIYVCFRGKCELQVVTGRCPRAAGNLERAQKYAIDNRAILKQLLEYLFLCESVGRGPLTHISVFTFGSSSAGWTSTWHNELNGGLSREVSSREINSILVVQISTDLIGDEEGITQRREIVKRILRECKVPVILSYPRVYDAYGEWLIEPTSAREWINEVLAFLEYLHSAPRSDIFRQPSDLKRILETFGGAAYIFSAVMGAEELSKFMRDLEARFLSPIPIRIDRNSPCVLLSLNPSRGLAETYGNRFKEAFKNAEIIATYEEEHTGGESLFILAVPIDRNKLDACLSQVGRKDYREE